MAIPRPTPCSTMRCRAFGLVLAMLASIASVPLTAPIAGATRGTIPGIDISQYQETINWAAVDPAKVAFVIMRATKGKFYVDPSYPRNVAGAASNGFAVGAYHRATPSSQGGDAKAEADFFIATARNAAGDIIPALDIEETGGLSVSGLQSWVKTWVRRVHDRLGVRPMVYASPYFWRTYMGDSRWFADQGYPLWIANWNVAAPDVPANNWRGQGWTFWQWSSTGSLRGIPTAVDRDRFAGTNLQLGKIASLTVASPNGGAVTGTRISCGDGATRCSRLINPGDQLTLTAAPDPGAQLLGWTGACSGAGTSSTCDVTVIGQDDVAAIFGYPLTTSVDGSGGGTITSPSGTDCPGACEEVVAAGQSVVLTATPDSASAFDGWTGSCSGLSASCSVRMNGPRTVGATFTATQRLEQDGPGTRFTWGSKRDARAIGGAYRTDHRMGSSLTYPFSGDGVTVFGVTSPAGGKASVRVDGSLVGTINGYAAATHFGVSERFSGYGPGAHSISITVTGTASPKSSGTRVVVDALRWGGRLRTDPHPSGGNWSSLTAVNASGGSYVANDVAGATASLRFVGTGATFVTVRGPGMGRAQIVVDGKLMKTIDLYAPQTAFDIERTVTGLPDGPHVLTVRVVGAHRLASGGSSVAIDAWIVR